MYLVLLGAAQLTSVLTSAPLQRDTQETMKMESLQIILLLPRILLYTRYEIVQFCGIQYFHIVNRVTDNHLIICLYI